MLFCKHAATSLIKAGELRVNLLHEGPVAVKEQI